MKKKVFGIIFTIMTFIIIGLTSLVVMFFDSCRYWRRRSEFWKNKAGFEKRNNEKAAKELIKLAVNPQVTSFQDLHDKLHNLNDISKEMKECCCTNSQKNQTL